jgi:AraC-like DNA-binding protein
MRKNVLVIVQNKQESGTYFENLHPDFQFFIATKTEEIWPVIECAPIQLILCTLNIPAVNGWDLCAHLKSSHRYSHIPVVLIACEDSLETKIKSLEAGADAHIVNPVSGKYLKALINNIISNRIKVGEYFTFSRQAAGDCKDLNNDRDFINELNHLIVTNIHNSSLNVGLLARQMNMSRATLYRRIKTITDLAPNDLIMNARLKYAAQLLATGGYKVFEIANKVGFQSPSSFGKAFIKQYKVTPRQYLQIKKQPVTAGHRNPENKPQLYYEAPVFTC